MFHTIISLLSVYRCLPSVSRISGQSARRLASGRYGVVSVVCRYSVLSVICKYGVLSVVCRYVVVNVACIYGAVSVVCRYGVLSVACRYSVLHLVVIGIGWPVSARIPSGCRRSLVASYGLVLWSPRGQHPSIQILVPPGPYTLLISPTRTTHTEGCRTD